MPMILVPLEEQTVTMALHARQRPDESLNAVFHRSVSACPAKPDAAPAAKSPPAPRPSYGRYKVTLCGEQLAADSLGKLLKVVITTLAELDRRCLEQIAGQRGRTRPIIARRPEALFPGSPHLKGHSLPICAGWYVGTNVSRRDVKRILRLLCKATGLSYRVDLVPGF